MFELTSVLLDKMVRAFSLDILYSILFQVISTKGTLSGQIWEHTSA